LSRTRDRTRGAASATPGPSRAAGRGLCGEASQPCALRSVSLREAEPGFGPTRVCGRLAVVALRTGVRRRWGRTPERPGRPGRAGGAGARSARGRWWLPSGR